MRWLLLWGSWCGDRGVGRRGKDLICAFTTCGPVETRKAFALHRKAIRNASSMPRTIARCIAYDLLAVWALEASQAYAIVRRFVCATSSGITTRDIGSTIANCYPVEQMRNVRAYAHVEEVRTCNAVWCKVVLITRTWNASWWGWNKQPGRTRGRWGKQRM